MEQKQLTSSGIPSDLEIYKSYSSRHCMFPVRFIATPHSLGSVAASKASS